MTKQTGQEKEGNMWLLFRRRLGRGVAARLRFMEGFQNLQGGEGSPEPITGGRAHPLTAGGEDGNTTSTSL